MTHFFLLTLFLVSFIVAHPALALDGPFIVSPPTTLRALGEVIDEAQCFNVINKAPYMVLGTINTNFFVRGDGMKSRHQSNFRLNTKKSASFCTRGPFYKGQKVELVLKTFIPIFKCKTAINGDIIIYGRKKPEGGTKTWAACL